MKDYYPALKFAAGVGAAAYRSYSKTNTVVLSKDKVDNMLTNSIYQRRKSRFGKYKKNTVGRVAKSLQLDEERSIHRWQFVSRWSEGAGKQAIWRWYDGSANTQLNAHIFDLTKYPNNPASATLAAGMNQVVCTNATGTISYGGPLRCQDLAGATQAYGTSGGFWERGGTKTNVAHGCLKWTDLRMNLYATYGNPVRFKIMLMRVFDEVSVPGQTTGTSDREKGMWDSIIHGHCYSNLLVNMGEQKKSYKIIKQWNHVVQPNSKTEQWNLNMDAGQENPAPNFLEFKAFIKHDYTVKYDWHDPVVAGANGNLTADAPTTNTMQTSSTEVHDSVYPTSRLYLVIVASSPGFGPSNSGTADVSATDLTDASASTYDIVLRRCFYMK